MKNDSEIISKMIGILYPFIIMFGFYIIINGHNSPGGGFQGGAVLAAVFISRYLVYPVSDFKLESFSRIEKIFFLCIIVIPVLYLFVGLKPLPELFNTIYLIIMNLLIGLKVCCGLSIIFFRFVFYEGR